MTLIDFDKKELLDIYRALQYTRFEECPVPHDDEGRELYNRLTKLMEKVSKTPVSYTHLTLPTNREV